jgi:hypothetical protein
MSDRRRQTHARPQGAERALALRVDGDPRAAADHSGLAEVDAFDLLASAGVTALPDHFDGRRKWRGLLAEAAQSADPSLSGCDRAAAECARALADRVAIHTQGALVLDLGGPGADELDSEAATARLPANLVALHRGLYVRGAREPCSSLDAGAIEAARRVRSLVYYAPRPQTTAHAGSTAAMAARVDAIRAEIYARGPISAAIAVHDDMASPRDFPRSWHGGIYRARHGATRVGTAVVTLLGWATVAADAAAGSGPPQAQQRREVAWIARGPFGPPHRTDRDAGTFLMAAGQCGAEDHAVAALPDLWGARLPARLLHDAAPCETDLTAAQRRRDLRAALALHPSGYTRTFVSSLDQETQRALAPLVDPARLPDYARFVAARARNPHEAPGSHDPIAP